MIRLPGIEAAHTWEQNGASYTFAGVDPASRSVWPHVRLEAIDGRHSRPDADDKRDLPVGRPREIPRDALLRGKTETWRGRVRGRTIEEMRDGVSELVAAFAENDIGQMTIHQPASYTGQEDLTYQARVLSCSAPDQQTLGPDRSETGGWERLFSVSFRLHDPRYAETLEREDVTSAMVPASAGMVLPVALPAPIVGTNIEIGATEVVNDGGGPVDPVLALFGPNAGPVIVNDTVGAQLSFPRLTLAAGQWLEVNFKTRQVLLNGESDARGFRDLGASTWWDAGVPGLAKGVNKLRYRGLAVSPTAYAVLTWAKATYG